MEKAAKNTKNYSAGERKGYSFTYTNVRIVRVFLPDGLFLFFNLIIM